jgi:hypothetical protein
MFCRPNMFVKTVLLKLFRRPKVANTFLRGCMRPADRILGSPDLQTLPAVGLQVNCSTDSKLVHRMLETVNLVISQSSIAPIRKLIQYCFTDNEICQQIYP